MSGTENAEPTTTYEQAREELADVVRRLEAGGLTLEESLALWERGEELAKLCQHWLDRARERLAAAAPAGDARPGWARRRRPSGPAARWGSPPRGATSPPAGRGAG